MDLPILALRPYSKTSFEDVKSPLSKKICETVPSQWSIHGELRTKPRLLPPYNVSEYRLWGRGYDRGGKLLNLVRGQVCKIMCEIWVQVLADCDSSPSTLLVRILDTFTTSSIYQRGTNVQISGFQSFSMLQVSNLKK